MKRKLRSKNMKLLSLIFGDSCFYHKFNNPVPCVERFYKQRYIGSSPRTQSSTIPYYDTALFWGGSYVEHTVAMYPTKVKSGYKPQYFWLSWINFTGDYSTVKKRSEKLEIYIHEEKTPL